MGESDCTSLMKKYILDLKQTQRVDDIEPGQWFKEELQKWTTTFSQWKARQTEWKTPAKKAAMIEAKKAELKKEQEGESEVDPQLPDVNVGDIDVLAVQNVDDLGNCEPLYAHFTIEDWTLLGLRYEIFLLLHAWKKDLNDTDRPSFGENHFPFYYNKYFKKPFVLKKFGVDSADVVFGWVQDAISVNKDSKQLETNLPEDAEFAQFMKLTEKHRRTRNRRVDAGDEGALIKFLNQRMQPGPQPAGAQKRPVGALQTPSAQAQKIPGV